MSLLSDIKRRHIIQVALVYVVVSWIVIQVGDVLLNNIGAPSWVLQAVMVLLALGLPVTLVMAWAHRLAPKEARDVLAASIPEPAPAPPARVAPPVSLAPGDLSIAVLPFVDMSPAHDQEYFADGLSEELLNLLARLPQLRVAARTSAFAFKGKDADIATIAGKLNVAHVLEGSVRKSGERIRITAQLIQARDGFHLWTETYDRTLEDIFAVQDDIAAEVVGALKLRILGGAVPTARETDPRTHTLYLKGRHLFNKGTPTTLPEAVECIREAVSIDPEYAQGWALLGSIYARMAGDGLMPSFAEGHARAREAIGRAIVLDPTVAESHVVLGVIASHFDWDYSAASRHLARALELDLGSTEALLLASILARYQGDFARAIELGRQAVDRDPVNPRPYVQLAKACYYAGRLDEAEELVRKILTLNPGRAGINTLHIELLLAQRNPQAALAPLDRETAEGWRMYGAVRVRRALGESAVAVRAQEEFEATHGEDMPFQIAELHGEAGSLDTAFAWLERAFRARDPGLPDAPVSPLLRGLHGDPRWSPFLKKIGLAAT